MPLKRYVETSNYLRLLTIVIDEHGRTSNGGLVLDKECLDALREVLNWRCSSYHSSHAGMLVEAANKLGETLYNRLGLEFQIYT